MYIDKIENMNSITKGLNKDIAQADTKIHYYESEASEVLKETGQYITFAAIMGGLVALPFINSMVQKIPEAVMMVSKFIP